MDDERGQQPDPVQNGDLPSTWMTRARSRVARLRAAGASSDSPLARCLLGEQQVSDDEIFEILTAGGHGKITADLCVAKGVTVPRYCVWKAKYRGLSLEALRDARRGEVSRARLLVGVVLAAAALGAGGIVFGVARAAQGNLTAAAPLSPLGHPVTASQVESAGVSTDVASAKAVSATLNPGDIPALAPGPAVAPGYNVQVVAAANLEQGRMFVERLAAAGHRAYVMTAIVNDAEVFRVRVGPFRERSEAEDVSRRLKRSGYAGAWIVR